MVPKSSTHCAMGLSEREMSKPSKSREKRLKTLPGSALGETLEGEAVVPLGREGLGRSGGWSGSQREVPGRAGPWRAR